MLTCLDAHVCMGAQAYVCPYVLGQRTILDALPQEPATFLLLYFIFRQDFSLAWNLPRLGKFLG